MFLGITLTLYKNCRLTDKYSNVLSKEVNPPNYQNSPFTSYLENLTKTVYFIDEVYQEENTVFNFYIKTEDYNSIYEYNYLKIETRSELNQVSIIRYAFIEEIKIVNELAQLKYKIDVWHTYIDKVKGINNSYLKGFRLLNGGDYGIYEPDYFTLPVDYEGNNALSFNPISNKDLNNGCNLFIQIQIYNTGQFGESTASTSRYVKISQLQAHQKIASGTWVSTYKGIFFSNVEKYLEEIINLSGGKNFMSNDESAPDVGDETYKAYFKIGKVFILPYNSAISGMFSDSGYKLKATTTSIPFWEEVSYYEEFILEFPNEAGYPTVIENFTIQHSFKNRAIGFYSLFLPISSNGTEITASLRFFVTRHQFSLILNYQNKVLDVSSIFEVFPPTTQLSGDVLAQQKISRAVANLEDIGHLVKMSTNLATSVYNGQANYVEAQNREDYYSSMVAENGTGQMGMISGTRSKDVATSGIIGNIVGSVVDMTDLAVKRAARNLPIYNSTGFVKINNTAFLNAIRWFGIYKISSDNDNIVRDFINNVGYNVYKYLNGNDYFTLGITTTPSIFTSDGVNYNVIQLGVSDVYGDFPLNVKKQLDAILVKGIKIWYDYTFTDDGN